MVSIISRARASFRKIGSRLHVTEVMKKVRCASIPTEPSDRRREFLVTYVTTQELIFKTGKMLGDRASQMHPALVPPTRARRNRARSANARAGRNRARTPLFHGCVARVSGLCRQRALRPRRQLMALRFRDSVL